MARKKKTSPKRQPPPKVVTSKTESIPTESPEKGLSPPLKSDGAPPPRLPPSSGRREFIRHAGRALSGISALAAVAGGIRFAIPDFREGLPSVLLLGKIADFKMNTVTWLRDFELFVRRNETGFEVLSSRCTHLGCTVRRSDEGFSCPCHGARYSADGTVLGGPAREPLPRYRVFVDGQGRVFADRGQIIEAKEPVPPDGE